MTLPAANRLRWHPDSRLKKVAVGDTIRRRSFEPPVFFGSPPLLRYDRQVGTRSHALVAKSNMVISRTGVSSFFVLLSIPWCTIGTSLTDSRYPGAVHIVRLVSCSIESEDAGYLLNAGCFLDRSRCGACIGQLHRETTLRESYGLRSWEAAGANSLILSMSSSSHSQSRKALNVCI